MKRIFNTPIVNVSLLAIMLSACSLPPRHAEHTDMAARIYTELATYYWQQGYTDIAVDRLTLALQQTPNYPPAMELMQQIQSQTAKIPH